MWALFEMKAWIGTENYLFEGNDVATIVRKLLKENDLYCIASMGRSMGTKSDQPQLSKIERFLKKYDNGNLSWEDLTKFEFKISTGSFRCIGIASEPEEVEKLKQQATRVRP